MTRDADSKAPEQVTELLQAWSKGDQAAFDQLAPVVYTELRRLARHYMGRERLDHTLQPTALVHEAYMRLADFRNLNWKNRVHFFAISAQVMRRVLVDFARSRERRKRGGTSPRLSLDDCANLGTHHDAALLALDDALHALASQDARKSRVVEMKFFGGLSTDEIAHSLGVSPDTVIRDWKLAKLWLLRELGAKEPGGAASLGGEPAF
jgi:RNA polymerase sigma-70 factor, ECF subfamily